MNIIDVLERQAAEQPRAPAIIDVHRGKRRETSFAALQHRAGQVSTLLARLGLAPGDSVLILQPMSLELYVVLLSLFRNGLVASFIDPAQGADHIERCCGVTAPSALVASPMAHALRLRVPALRRIPVKLTTRGCIPGAVSLQRAFALGPETATLPAQPDTPALITFTSGSTGLPKAASRSHGFLLAQHRVLERTTEPRPGAIDMPTLPVFVLSNLAVGAASVIADARLTAPGRIEAAPVLRQLRHEGVTRIAGSPALFERLCEYGERHDLRLPGVERVFTGGAPVFPDLLSRMQRLFPGAVVAAVYGSTEAEPIAHVEHHAISESDLTAMLNGGGLLAGSPVADIRVAVIRGCADATIPSLDQASFDRLQAATREVGEIVVTGPHVLKGYIHGRGDEETKFRVDDATWHRTGDAGYRDEQGRLWLLGRCGAEIGAPTGTLYPFAVETAARNVAGVRRAALVTHEGKRTLCIERRGAMATAAVDELQRMLEAHGLDRLAWLDAIPVDKRHNAKVDYPTLRHLLSRRRG